MVKAPPVEVVDSVGGATAKLRQEKHLGVLFFRLNLGYTVESIARSGVLALGIVRPR